MKSTLKFHKNAEIAWKWWNRHLKPTFSIFIKNALIYMKISYKYWNWHLKMLETLKMLKLMLQLIENAGIDITISI